MSYQTFTTLAEVQTHLNMTGPDANSNYTVYGLTIAAASCQGHVDHANKYLSSMVPDLLEGTAIIACQAQSLQHWISPALAF